MSLAVWHERLQRHFDTLRQSRSATVGDKPLFGLEHGLETADVDALVLEVKAQIARAGPSRTGWLPWIVYGAEIGYRYAGDEFWQTFVRETVGWEKHGDRAWLRECFQRFHKEFGGAKPSGPWANHFTIICWPITHAILPRDLQRQLAEILYSLRSRFSAELLRSPLELGQLIAAHSWNTNSRFQNLTEEPLLVGQIATALLLQGTHSSDSLILPATLKRIAADLQRTASAREWLRDAQHEAQQRFQFRGLSSGSGRYGELAPASWSHVAREEIAKLGIEPQLVLRPAGRESWDVLLEFPDFSGLLARFPAFRSVLTGSRCVVAGSSGRPLARGALLHEAPQVVLRTWPGDSEVLLRFEEEVPPEFEYFLRAECLLRPGHRRLFRIASDGLAYELRSELVRPGQSYIVARPGEPWEAVGGIRPVQLGCKGIQAARIDLPGALSGEWARLLEDLDVGLSKSVEVWPAGIPAANWDGQGRAEWLTQERPCVAIRPDHEVDTIVVTVNGGSSERLEMNALKAGLPVFVELPHLPPGSHKVRVAARADGYAAQERNGELEVVVREPRAWMSGANARGALRINIDPPVPTLEQVWEGRINVDISGPTGRQIIATISLFERHASQPSVCKRLPPLPFPVDAEIWRLHFDKHFRNAKDVQPHYDPAHSCRVELNAEELGGLSLTCEREFSPFRWVVRRHGPAYELSLLDDSGSPSGPNVSRYDFATPDKAVAVEAARFSGRYAVPAAGGLYQARSRDLERSVIVPPSGKLTLQELTIEPKLQRRPRAASAMEELLTVVRVWYSARLTGFFSATNRRSVLVALLQEILAMVAGEKWAKAEKTLRLQEGSAGLETLKYAISTKQQWANLGSTLLRDSWVYSTLEPRDRAKRFAATIQRLTPLRMEAPVAFRRRAREETLVPVSSRSPGVEWLSEFALRLASSPHDLSAWAGENLRRGLEGLLEASTLARAARFLVLAVDKHTQGFAANYGGLYQAWDWK